LGDRPKPDCKDDEILVKVHAAGINPIDSKVRSGLFADIFKFPFPLVLGWDMAGTIEAVGNKVNLFKSGAKVYSLVNFPDAGNCYAEYVVVKEEQVWHKPDNFSFEEAAACPLVALTAWQVLFEIGNLKPSQKVLIHAGAGGVGHMAIQLAKAKGAYVYTTCSSIKRSLVTQLGADVIIDYQQDSFQEKINSIDLVIDTVGGDVTKKSLSVLKEHGILVSIASQITPDIQELADKKSINAQWHLVHPSQAQLKEITKLANDGLIKVHLSDSVYYKSVIKAHEKIETGHTQGKIVLTF
jgi:NADPH:quinone reductase-like Zn-dependent oxidoreductase